MFLESVPVFDRYSIRAAARGSFKQFRTTVQLCWRLNSADSKAAFLRPLSTLNPDGLKSARQV